MNKQMLVTMLTMQDTANQKMNGPGWVYFTNGQRPDYRAAWIEAAEGIMHHGYKWWKKETPDIKQLKLELVDMWHFMLSESIRTIAAPWLTNGDVSPNAPGNEKYIDTVSDYILDRYHDTRVLQTNTVLILEKFVCATITDRCATDSQQIKLFYSVMDTIDFSFDELFVLYVAKNTLNLFRTNNGQKQGTYFKIWNGREDNEYLFDIAESYIGKDMPEDMQTEVYNKLESIYINLETRAAG